MAYSKNKELKTRIALKYDSYANWMNNNPVLLAGEIAIATIETGNSQTVTPNAISLPQTLIKVGDGKSTYSVLPFVSALAADVYDWAKKAQKPSYAYHEIAGLDDRIVELSDVDTNTEYKIVAVDAASYKYEIQKRTYANNAWGEWAKDQDFDLSNIDSRLDSIEAVLASAGFTPGEDGTITPVGDLINEAIKKLNGAPDQEAAEANGWIAAKAVQENGILTGIEVTLDASKYDAAGAAKAVQDDLDAYKESNDVAVAAAKKAGDDAQAAVEAEAEARGKAIEALNFAGVEGTQEGTVVKFVDKISEANGIIDAELGELHFNSAYNAETNKIATMSDIADELRDVVADLNGAMHFVGISTTDPAQKVTIADDENYAPEAGDVVIFNTIEWVYDGKAWQQLGAEGALGAALATMTDTFSNDNAGKTIKTFTQNNGIIEVDYQDIAIEKSAVNGLVKDLEDLVAKDNALVAEDERLAGLISANAQAISTINGTDTGKNMRTVAADEAAKAIAGTQGSVTAETGKYVASVSLANGILSGTLADLPTIQLEEGTASTPETSEVSVVADIDVSGHKITDTRVKVATAAGLNAKIQALGSSVTATTGSVLTGITQENGVLTGHTEVALATIATSGNVKDLVQTAETYVLFNCGTSSDVIDAPAQ